VKALILSGAMLALSISAPAAPVSRTFIGYVTDTMCGVNHVPMKIAPDGKCVRECVKGGAYKFAFTDGKVVYKLNDQQAPEHFAGQKVKVRGVLYERTNTIAVETIERAK
jgi:hypothetical protein